MEKAHHLRALETEFIRRPTARKMVKRTWKISRQPSSSAVIEWEHRPIKLHSGFAIILSTSIGVAFTNNQLILTSLF